ncbi:sybindin-like family domain-containing protein [Ditylenchus destructor]|nr:sybindin-like family domain-containing protein [Ditylenchus destructor]
MSIYQIFIINPAGSLIFNWDNNKLSKLPINEKIVLSSVFHSLQAIISELSPVEGSSEITRIDTTHFRLHCFQSLTGIKFLIIASPALTQEFEPLLRQLYGIYADYAIKNPFFSVDMPVRCDNFDAAIKQLLENYENILFDDYLNSECKLS